MNAPTLADVRFIVRELGSRAAALSYCQRHACGGPLAPWYAEAAALLDSQPATPRAIAGEGAKS